MRSYREGGLSELLKRKTSSSRPRALPSWAEAALQKRLQNSQGFNGYQAICDWFKTELGIDTEYKTAHKLVRYRLQSASKYRAP